MATRLYLPGDGTPAASPAFDAAWTDTSGGVRRPTSTEKALTAAANSDGGAGGQPGPNVLLGQFISAPLAEQEISGTVKGQVVCREFDPDIDARSQCVIRVVSGDGSTVRGTLLAAHSAALSSEWTTTNRKVPLAALSPAALSPVNAQEGDRLVIEIGARVGDNNLDEVRATFGDNQGSDLPEDETSSAAAGDPWIELSADIVFSTAAPTRAVGGGLSVGVGL